jgi:hypothetical protein
MSPNDTTNYIEIGFDAEQKYFYADFVGTSDTKTLAQPSGSYPLKSEFIEKWYNIVVTWHTQDKDDAGNPIASDADKIYLLNLYVNGDLVASNEAFGEVGRFKDIINGITGAADGTPKLQIHTGLWHIDELRYDQALVTDEEVFNWYQSDVPFIHNVPSITVAEFNHVNLDQLIKTLVSGAASGRFEVDYAYDGSQRLSTATFSATTGAPWAASVTYSYDVSTDFLTSVTFEIDPNGNGDHWVQVVETYTYNTNPASLEFGYLTNTTVATTSYSSDPTP